MGVYIYRVVTFVAVSVVTKSAGKHHIFEGRHDQ